MVPAGFEDYLCLFTPHGGTDIPYLRRHYPRYVHTKQRILAHRDRTHGNKLLDIGAHWLHQAVLYAIDGFEVTAVDLPVTFETHDVRALAHAHGIELLPDSDLEHPTSLKEIPDDSFDLVLFTEIIEHITFNPVAMWREIYRVMKPGARLIVTTPNHYALRGRAWNLKRFLTLAGGGVEVTDILCQHTHAHHWKEYSLSELLQYFRMLSPDFAFVDRVYVEEYEPTYLARPGGKLVYWLERTLPPLRPDLYLAIELAQKNKGIVVEPHW